MANPFEVSVPQINPLAQLMAGYSAATGIRTADDQRQARQAAQNDLLSGDTQSALARLLGAGDTKGAAVLATTENSQRAANSLFGTPIYGRDPQTGQTVVGTFDRAGQWHLINTGGIAVTPGIRTIDTGTGTVLVDSKTGAPIGNPPPKIAPQVVPPQTPPPTGLNLTGPNTKITGIQYGPVEPISPDSGRNPGQVVQPVQVAQIPTTPGYFPKDVAGAAAQKKYGTAKGEAQASLASMQSKLPGLQAVVNKLDDLSNKATYTLAGQAYDYGRRELGLSVRDSAVARQSYIATVRNQILPLLRDTFGAQFTAREGDSLLATLGDPNLAPKEKQAVLKSFIAQKVRDVQAMQTQAGAVSSPTATPQSQGYGDGTRAKNPQTGQIIELRGGQWVPVQ
jgi:hypothetical protein